MGGDPAFCLFRNVNNIVKRSPCRRRDTNLEFDFYFFFFFRTDSHDPCNRCIKSTRFAILLGILDAIFYSLRNVNNIVKRCPILSHTKLDKHDLS